MRAYARETSEDKLTLRQPYKASLSRSENAAVIHSFTALGIVPWDDPFFWTTSSLLQGFNCPHVHCGRFPHSLLACGRPRQLYVGITVFLVCKPEAEGVKSSLPDKYILLSRAVRQGYIILQSRINKLALSSVCDFEMTRYW